MCRGEASGWVSSPYPSPLSKSARGWSGVAGGLCVWRCFSAVSAEPVVCRGGGTWLGLFPLTPVLFPTGEGVDSVLLMVFWSGVAFVSKALRGRYAAHGNARAASMSRPASPRRTGPLSLRERARVRGRWSAKSTVLKPPRSPPPVGQRAPGSRVAHGCPSPPRRPER